MNDEPNRETLNTIVVGYDERPEGRDALHLARNIAQATGAKLLVASVFAYHRQGMGLEAFEKALREDGERVFAPALEELEGMAVETFALADQGPAVEIRELARTQDADLIIVGSTHRSKLGRVLPGSTAERLLTEAHCPVAVAPRGFAGSEADTRIRVIAVAYDGGDEADAALTLAIELATAEAATLRLITVNPPPPHGYTVAVYDPRLRDSYSAALEEAVTRVPPEQRPLPRFRDGDPASVIVKEAELGVDLLVIGSHGWGPFGRVVLGSVSSKVMRKANCPVLMVPSIADSPSDRAKPVSAELGSA